MNPSISPPQRVSIPASLLKKQLVVLGCLLAARGIGAYAIPDEIGEQKSKIALALPPKLGGWTGRDVKVDPVVYEVLQPDAVLQKRFRLPAAGARGPEVEVLVVYSRDPKGLHSPVTCMRAQGWTISDETRRVAKSGSRTLMLDILTGQQRERRTQLAYCFTDASEAVSGRVATFARMIAARVMRRRIGAVEMQFAYDARALDAKGDFTPELQALMIQTAAAVRAQLAAQSQN